MNKIAVPHARVKAPLALLAATAILLVVPVGTAGAAPAVGKDGKIHACYRVKGKPKGSLRVVPGQKRCRRGERKVIWSAAGPSGQAGSTGQSGSGGTGSQGQAGSDGSPGSNEATLKTDVAALSLKVDGLEGTLDGVTNGELNGVVNTLDGLTKTELLETVDSLPVVDSLCQQNEELTEQVNLLQDVIGGLGLSPALEALGLLEIPTLPTELDPFVCPTP